MRRAVVVVTMAVLALLPATAIANAAGGSKQPSRTQRVVNLCVQNQAQINAKPWLAKDIATAAGTGNVPVLRAAKLGMFNLMWAQQAITHQVDTQLRDSWHTPMVRFACQPRNTRVFLLAGPGPANAGPHPLHKRMIGYHWVHNGALYIVVFVSKDVPWSVVLSHEVIERLGDPFGGRPEIADPVEGHWYRVWGRWVDDFVLPSWFSPLGHAATSSQKSRTDYLGFTSDPGEISHGYFGSKRCPHSTCYVSPTG